MVRSMDFCVTSGCRHVIAVITSHYNYCYYCIIHGLDYFTRGASAMSAPTAATAAKELVAGGAQTKRWLDELWAARLQARCVLGSLA